MSSQIVVRRVIWTGAITAVTVVGAIYGAGLKTRQEVNEESKNVKPVQEIPDTNERVQQLERVRGQLTAKKLDLEKKLEEIERRRAKKASNTASDS